MSIKPSTVEQRKHKKQKYIELLAVEILEEEGPNSAEEASINTAEKFARLESTMHAQTGLISHLQQCLDNLETRTQAQCRDLQFLVRQVNMPGKVTVECPVCLEVCVPGMRLRQCGQVLYDTMTIW